VSNFQVNYSVLVPFPVIRVHIRLGPVVSCLLKANAGLQRAKTGGLALNPSEFYYVSIWYEPAHCNNQQFLNILLYGAFIYMVSNSKTIHIIFKPIWLVAVLALVADGWSIYCHGLNKFYVIIVITIFNHIPVCSWLLRLNSRSFHDCTVQFIILLKCFLLRCCERLTESNLYLKVFTPFLCVLCGY